MSDGTKTDWAALIYGLMAMLIAAQLILSFSLGIDVIYLEIITVVLSVSSIYMVFKKGDRRLFKMVGIAIILLSVQFYKEETPLIDDGSSLIFQQYYQAISTISILIFGLQMFPSSKGLKSPNNQV